MPSSLPLADFINRYPFLEEKSVELLLATSEAVELPAGTTLLERGQYCRKLYYVEQGFARGYYYTQKGEEVTTWFWSEGDIMVSFEAFLRQTPSEENIEILQAVKARCLTHDQLQQLYAADEALSKLGRLLTEEAAMKMGQLTVFLRSRSARERYEQLIGHYPQLLERSNLRYIAGYLGITPETLSRVRAALKES